MSRARKETAIAMTTMGLILALFAIAFKGCQPPEPQFDTPTPTANIRVVTPTPSATPSPTGTATATATPTAIILIIRTATPTATATDSPTATPTATATASATPTATATERLWYYWTPEPTATVFTVYRRHCVIERNLLGYYHLICIEVAND